MKRGKRELSGEERRLWTRVTSGLKPRRVRAETPAARPEPDSPPLPRPSKPERDPARPTGAKPPAPPADRGAEKRVRRGRLEIGATLDLHGHTQASGQNALERFIARSCARGDRVVLVVTGVGRGGEGVLKRRLPDWLAEPALRPFVSGYSKAHRSHGGEGAFYVFLRAAR